MNETDILIIGAGVIGLAIANELSQVNNIFVVEKKESFGQETSSRNSEVVHSGIYYPFGALKTKLCIEGRHLLYELCEKQNIPFKKTGKLIVATAEEEIPSLNKIFKQGIINGVSTLKILNKQELKKIEPNIRAIAAILSPETGIIDSHALMRYFFENSKSNGVMYAFNSEVVGIEKKQEGYKVVINNSGVTDNIKTRVLINCAGLDADMIAAMSGIDIKRFEYELNYCKGQYFRVSNNKSSLLRHLIYPIPMPNSGGLGIHATLDLSGGLRLGPDDEYSGTRERDYSVDGSKRRAFFSAANKFLPFIEEDDLCEDSAGIRPKLPKHNIGFRDFIIKEESEKGLNGFINLIGMESPGLTASPAIAKLVKNYCMEIWKFQDNYYG